MNKEQFLPILVVFLILTFSRLPASDFSLSDVTEKTISVEVKGAVKNPGIYEMEKGSTIGDLLKRITLSEKADLSSINSLIVLKDKDMLNIPQKASMEPSTRSAVSFKVSINTASVSELMSLSGIGEKTAQAIIDYRNSYGLFQSLEELKNVKGIGDKKYEKIVSDISL